MDVFDYIIVGAGSAGCVLANKLTAEGKYRVLLLEAGPLDNSFWIKVPIGYGRVFYDQRFNWKYTTEPEQNLNDRKIYWPRGKVVGGSSSINAMVYVRGHPADYAEWGAVAPGWNWPDVAPIFHRMEDYQSGTDPVRGTGGPLRVTNVSEMAHPLSRVYLSGAEQAGLKINPDYNGRTMDGACLYQITTRNGRRASAAQSYLKPALRRSHLCLETGAYVHRIYFEGKRAVGLTYAQKGKERSATCTREIILCAGAINSPQLLQLSGIGPGQLLQNHAIPVVHDAPQVGQNLRDHLGVDMTYRASAPSLNQVLRPFIGKMAAGIQYLLTRTGPLALSLNQGGGFMRCRGGAGPPDLQLYFSPLSYTRAPAGTRSLLRPDPFPGFLLGCNPCKPTSRGSVSIQSPDPHTAPVLRGNYLDTEHDRDMMIRGLRVIRKIAETPAMQGIIDCEMAPGPACESDAALLAFAQRESWTVYHQCGTCRMGRDAARSVVDERLRVHGVSGLRVADASIFPTIPTGNTNAPAIMVGEKASDLIRQDARLCQGLV